MNLLKFTVPVLQDDIKGGKTAGYIYSGATPIGFFSLSDACRRGAQEAIWQLKLLSIKTAMLTGDSQAAAVQAQEQLGNALELVHAELLPEDKVKIIKEFKREGPTAMVGDGLNDAPALATADIGISMGISGSALASETGNIILMSNDIRKIPQAIKLARKARRKVIENMILSVITKAAIIGLAFAGYPLVWAAVLADVGTCLLVILNSMLLLRERHVHGGKSCRSSAHSHAHKSGCHGESSHHQNQHHGHEICCSDKKGEVSQPVKCDSHNCASKCDSRPSNSSLVGNINCHGNCKGNDELHEPKHRHHQGICESKHGVPSRDFENKACSGAHNLSQTAERKCTHSVNSHRACLEDKKSHGISQCHHRNCDIFNHDRASSSSDSQIDIFKESQQISNGDCHSICGCENHRGQELGKTSGCNHAIEHQHPDPHSDFKKNRADHTSIDIISENEHVESATMDASVSLKKKEGSCCNGCPDKSKNFPVVQSCASSNEGEVDACCRSEYCSKESAESPIVHACLSLDKREIGGCCKSYMRECCKKHGHLGDGFGGGSLSEIVTE